MTISEDPDELLHWATIIGGRYMGAEHLKRYVAFHKGATAGGVLSPTTHKGLTLS